MNEHAGPACALSVLIVGIFAVLLHERDQPPLPSKSAIRNAADAKAGLPDPDPGNLALSPIRETALISPPPSPRTSILKEAATPTPARKPEPSKRPAEPDRSVSGSRTSLPGGKASQTRKVVPRPPPPGPRSPFTVVESGETLADVATRVYGSPEAREAVWKANRDQIARIDSPLARGTLLRTP